ncbi:polysaccharide deacetylase family protein [Cryptosporangium sp. NPDC051539]|uniref:polysaccharide deacetylase family protein n=1 Tax=Cryptosporangium sp. NPDC051539 TaxID=3363962 RepID=UPI00379FA426
MTPDSPRRRARFTRRAVVLGGAASATAAGLGALAGRDLFPRSEGDRSARPSPFVGPVGVQLIWRLSGVGRRTALTFDDGPDPRWTPRVLEVLAAHGARATFFMIGTHAARHPDLVRRVADAGHEIGNHTWSHRRIDQLDARRLREQLDRTQATLADLTGREPTLLRPPWGEIDAPGLLTAAQLGLRVVLWSDLVRGAHPDHDLRRLLSEVQPGAVILGHDGGPTPDDHLMSTFGTLVDRLSAAGHVLTTVSAALSDPSL